MLFGGYAKHNPQSTVTFDDEVNAALTGQLPPQYKKEMRHPSFFVFCISVGWMVTGLFCPHWFDFLLLCIFTLILPTAAVLANAGDADLNRLSIFSGICQLLICGSLLYKVFYLHV